MIRNRHLAEWRFSRFFIIIVTVKEPICKVIRMVSPPFGWCGRPPAVCAASLNTIVPYRAQKSSPPGREGLLRLLRLQADRAVGALRAREQGRALG